MTSYPITDHDDAYANAAHIPGAADFPPRWMEQAATFRSALAAAGRARLDVAYAPGARNRYDLFLPERSPRGLTVFIHGGYWKAFDKSVWSHLAAGPLAHDMAVAMPSYTLCPDARISDIAREIASAIAAVAGEVDGPLVLSGHSAGGQLAARMVSGEPVLAPALRDRIAGVVPISGVFDLRPIRRTTMNDILKVDAEEAGRESPQMLEPHVAAPVTVWVGLAERPEFIRQSRALAETWKGFSAPVRLVEETGKHHFDVIDGFADPDHPIARTASGLFRDGH